MRVPSFSARFMQSARNRLALGLFLRANRAHLWDLLMAGLLVNSFALAFPLFSMLVYDKVMGNPLHATLWALTVGVVLFIALDLVLRLMRVHLLEHAGARWDLWLEERLMTAVLRAPLHVHLSAATVSSRVRELSASRDVLAAQSLLCIADLPFVLCYAVIIGCMAGWMVCIPLLAAMMAFGLTVLSQRWADVHTQSAQRLAHRRMQGLMDVITARTSLSGTLWPEQLGRHHRGLARKGGRASARGRWWQQVHQQVFLSLLLLSSVAILVAGVFQVERQVLTVGGLISVSMLSSRLMSSLYGLGCQLSRWPLFAAALTRFLGDLPDVRTPPASAAMAPIHTGQIELHGLHAQAVFFAWPDQQQAALSDIHLHLQTGRLYAVVGQSGSGKSSLLGVLSGQWSIASGSLVLGGLQWYADLASSIWSQSVYWMPQLPVFLTGTVRDIVSGATPDADEGRVLSALQQAGLYALVLNGKLALNRVLKAGASCLSVGQQKQLALACALYSRASVLLLDEPTSGLDPSAQSHVIRTLQQERKRRCIVVSTHASALAACADELLVLDAGRLRAQGPPARLLNKDADAPDIEGDAVIKTSRVNES